MSEKQSKRTRLRLDVPAWISREMYQTVIADVTTKLHRLAQLGSRNNAVVALPSKAAHLVLYTLVEQGAHAGLAGPEPAIATALLAESTLPATTPEEALLLMHGMGVAIRAAKHAGMELGAPVRCEFSDGAAVLTDGERRFPLVLAEVGEAAKAGGFIATAAEVGEAAVKVLRVVQ